MRDLAAAICSGVAALELERMAGMAEGGGEDGGAEERRRTEVVRSAWSVW